MRPTYTQILGDRPFALLAHAFVSWALCAAAMMIPMALVSVEFALVFHAIAAPIIAGTVSWYYYRRFGGTTPLQTALVFLGLVVVVDFFLVALVIERSFEMFADPLGTWIPFASIFAVTYLMGRLVGRRTPKSPQGRHESDLVRAR
jgi:hypothetical protein